MKELRYARTSCLQHARNLQEETCLKETEELVTIKFQPGDVEHSCNNDYEDLALADILRYILNIINMGCMIDLFNSCLLISRICIETIAFRSPNVFSSYYYVGRVSACNKVISCQSHSPNIGTYEFLFTIVLLIHHE
jgi:hypothetical protein